jgi:parallel beta-helix repeat protein
MRMKSKISALAVAMTLLTSMFLIAIPVVSADTLEVGPGKPYSTIQAAIDAAGSGDTILVYPMLGSYAPFNVSGKIDLTIVANTTHAVIVNGSQSVTTNYGARDAVIFIEDSFNVTLEGFDIEGFGLGIVNAKNYAVIYENSSGTIRDCVVSPNTIGDLDSTGIGAWDGSDLIVDPCTIRNFGRIGVFYFNNCSGGIYDSSIIGQVYGDAGDVNYGIEIEGLYNACDVEIVGNEIYNCDNTNSTPTWTSSGILVDGWMEYYTPPTMQSSNVVIEENDLHDNYIGIDVVANLLCHTHYNDIYNNRIYGVRSGSDSLGNNVTLDARFNWWGDASGPTHSSNIGGVGDAVSDYGDYSPWFGAAVDTTPRTYHVNPTGTIQDAIDDASPGDTINVHAGTYAGAVVDKDVAISGVSGGVSIITSGVPYKVGSTLYTAFRIDDTADGAEISDFAISCNSSEGFYFAVFSRNADDVIVDSLTVNDAVQGITNWGGSSWKITNNVLNNTEAAGGGGIAIWLGAFPPDYPLCSGNLIQNNIITASATAPDYTCPGIGIGLDLRYGAYDDLTGSEDISNNQILNNTVAAPGALNGVGVEIGVLGLEDNTTKIEAMLGVVHDNAIKHNTIDGADLGIYFYTVANLEIEQNDIQNCNEGIHIKDGSIGNTINYNNIFGNTIGVNNTSGELIDTSFNWWGDSSGPSGFGPGAGDAVSENVSFDPWLSCYQLEVLTQICIDPPVMEKYGVVGIEGTTFEVTVRIQDVADLYGFEFNVTWNSSLITLVGVEYTSQLDLMWGIGHWTTAINETGTGWYRLVVLALAPAVGFDGDSDLAELTFKIEYGPCYIEPYYQLQTRIHFAKVKLSDSNAQAICAEVHDGKYIIYARILGLKIRPTTMTAPITCRKMGEQFTTEIKLIDAFKISGFDFEIHYNTTLLDVVDVQWGDLSGFLPGPYIMKQIIKDDLNGLIRFQLLENVSDGAPLAYGDGILARITFEVIKTKVWKNCPEWTNYIKDFIAFTDWNLTVMCPATHHLTGGLVYLIDMEYQFSPIQGDIDSTGVVDIFDITAVASYYDIEESDPEYISNYDLNCDGIIDLYDLVLIGVNFGYEYIP